MVRRLVTDRMETAGKREAGRREADSLIWGGLKDKLALGALALAAGCGHAAVQSQPATTPNQGQQAVSTTPENSQSEERPMILEYGHMSAGQVEIGTHRSRQGGLDLVTAQANVVGGNSVFNWLIYQDVSPGTGLLLLNPRYNESSQARYVGVVMRGITLTDGTSGDFVVRVYGNASRPASASEFGPVAESDGRIRPENVLYRLEQSSLAPVLDTQYYSNRGTVSFIRDAPDVTVPEYGPVTPVVVIQPVPPEQAGRGAYDSEGVIAFVPPVAITRDRDTRVNAGGSNETIATFTATSTMVTLPGRVPMELAEYEARNGSLHLVYDWLMFQNVQPSTGLLLLNPQYRDTAQPRYAGMLLRGATASSGETGDFVVRVRRLEPRIGGLEWAPIIEADGRVRSENILFRMRQGTLEPVRDDDLTANIRRMAFEQASNQVAVVEYGPTTPVLMVHVAVKMAATSLAVPATATQISPRQ